MFKEERSHYLFKWEDVGDIGKGRPNLGSLTEVAIYRLMQFTLRDVLITRFNVNRANQLFAEAGWLAGSEFCKNVLNTDLAFHEFIADLQEKLKTLRIGVLRVEKFDPERLALVVTVSEDLDCSGLPPCGETVCNYDEGFIAGILDTYTGKSFHVREIDCWASGGRTCRFLAQPHEKPASGFEQRSERESLDLIREALQTLLRGELPEGVPIPENFSYELAELCQTTNELVRSFAEAQSFITSLAKGDLRTDPPAKNQLVAPFKELHSNLRHLTWQTGQIAAGQLDHRVDFLGEFATAFNCMIDSLREKRKMEAALAASDARFRQLAENIEEVFWLIHVEGGAEWVEYISPSFEKVWGISTVEIYKDPRAWLRVIHEQDRDLVERQYEDFIQGLADYKPEYEIVLPDGRLRRVCSKGFAIRDEKGKIVRVGGISQDITPRRLDEKT